MWDLEWEFGVEFGLIGWGEHFELKVVMVGVTVGGEDAVEAKTTSR